MTTTTNSTTVYRVTMSDGWRWRFAADLSQASSPLYLLDEDGERVATQYQVADACHDARQAAELLWPVECEGDGEVPELDVAGVKAVG